MSLFYSLKDNIIDVFTRVPTDSKFEEGVLTPQEFVIAGDALVQKVSNWSWNAGEKSLAVDYLPPDKQYLMTKRVTCMSRVKSQNQASIFKSNVVLEGQNEEDGWLTAIADAEDDIEDIADEAPKSLPPVQEDDDDDEELEDLDEVSGSNLLVQDDPASLPSKKVDSILKTRTYDISITYDKYYQTPRVWLFGYDEDGKPLKTEKIFEDISQDHANKTVTIEKHPHLGIPFAFIHPCKHAVVMKKIIGQLVENKKELRVDQYLFLFLKFISSVIPTMEYDFTAAMETS